MKIRKSLIIGLTAMTVLASSFAATPPKFSDVKSSDWAYATINWAAEQNIVHGYVSGTFKPNQTVTEAEFLTIFVNAFVGEQPKGNGRWDSGTYKYAKEKNWAIRGSGSLKVRDGAINRMRVAELVTGALGVNYSGDDAIRYMLANDLAAGRTGKKTVSGFKGEENLTRAEAVQFVKNLKDSGITEMKDRPPTPSDPSKIPALPDEVVVPPQQGDLELKEATKTDVAKGVARSIGYMPRDTVSEPFITSLVESLVVKGGEISGTAPSNLPSGYSISVTGDNGNMFAQGIKPGSNFSYTFTDIGVSFVMALGNTVKQTVDIYPDGKILWGAIHK